MKFKISKTKLIYSVAILTVLFFGAFLRLYRIADYMTFLGDEGRDVLVVYNILHGKLTLLGPTASVGGFFLGPIYYYFIAPFLLLSGYNPVGPAIMVALFGIATVFLIYRVGVEFFGQETAIAAAALYAVSPVVIAYSRSSWNPNLMPFFSLLTLYTLYKAVAKNKIYLFCLAGFFLGIAMQLHYLTVFLGVIVATYILILEFPRHTEIFKKYIYILAGFIIGLSPFLAFEARHDFANIRSIINFIFHSGDTGGTAHFFEIIGNVFFRLFGRLVTTFPPPEQVALGAHPNIAFWYLATLILAIFSVIVLLNKLVKAQKKRNGNFSAISLIAIWLVVGIGLFGFYKKPIYDYYFGFMFPLPFLLVGNLITSVSFYSKYAAVILFLVLFVLNINAMPFKYTPNRQLAQVKEISNFVLSKTNGRPFNFALITLGNSDHGYRYFFKLEGRDPVVIQTHESDPKRTSVTDQILIVCEDQMCQPLGNSLWEVAGFGRAEIVDEWDVSVVKVYKLTHYKGK